MAEPYSIDLRERVVAACDEGETRAEVAERFGVSVRFVYGLLRLRRVSGSVAPKPRRGGFPSAVDGPARQMIRELVAAQPDAELRELCDRLAARGGPRVGPSRMCQVLRELGLPLKKRRGSPPSKAGPT